MDLGELDCKSRDVEATWSCRGDAEVAAGDLAAIGQALEVEEPGGPLQVGQGLGGGGGEALEFSAAGELPAQHVHERLVVALQDTEQDHDIAADVVDHLGGCAERPPEEDATHADEGLDIGVVRNLRQPLDDPLRQVALAAEVGAGRRDGGEGD